jgi:DNA-binding transcriptional ArsR family regulator
LKSAYAAKKDRRTEERFVMIEKDLLMETDAFKKLKGNAFKVYAFLRSRVYGDVWAVNGTEIPMSYKLLVKVTGISISTVRTALISLENLGFIDLVEQGGLKSGGHEMNIYSISTRYMKYGTEEFKEGTMKKQKGVFDRGFGLHWKNKQ